jgi:hypothetical protein
MAPEDIPHGQRLIVLREVNTSATRAARFAKLKKQVLAPPGPYWRPSLGCVLSMLYDYTSTRRAGIMPKKENLYMTKNIPAFLARTQFGQILEPVSQNNERFLVTKKGQAKAAILGVEDFSGNG